MDPTEEKVLAVIEREEDKAWKVYRGASVDPAQIRNDEDRRGVLLQFLDDLRICKHQYWSNLPNDVKLSHYLLCGVPVTLDLHRWSNREEIVERTGLTLRALEECYETHGGYLSFNLYERNPAYWKEYGHLECLIDRSVANGTRVDYFIRLIYPRFDTALCQHEKYFASIHRDNPVLWSALEVHVKQPTTEDKIKWLAYQWLYMEVFCEDALYDLDNMLKTEQVGDAFELLKVAKRLYVSPFSGAIGGELVWSGAEWSWYRKWREQDLPYLKETSDKLDRNIHDIVKIDPKACEYLVHELGKCHPITILDRLEAEQIMSVLRRDDWFDLRQKIFRILTDLTELLQKGDTHDVGKGVNELGKYLNEQRDILKAYKISGEAPSNVTTITGEVALFGGPMAYALGTLTDPWTAAAIGAGGLAGKLIGRSIAGPKLGEWMFRLGRPLHHKIFVDLDKLEKQLDN